MGLFKKGVDAFLTDCFKVIIFTFRNNFTVKIVSCV